MNKSLLIVSVCLALCMTETTAATLQSGDYLSIDSGSSFSLSGSLSTPILGESGITVGPTPGDMGTGSHAGSILPGDVGGATQPWLFSGNMGYDYLSATTGSGNFGGDTITGVDMSTWTVSWNGIIGDVPMGGCGLVAGGCDGDGDGVDDFSDTGIGAFSWNGVYGDTYTISYTAHIPIGDPSGLGGIQYDLFLTGTVSAVPVPAAVWLFGSGLVGLIGAARRNKKS